MLILTPDEVQELTRRSRPGWQAKQLDFLRIPYRRRSDGSLVVLSADVQREHSGSAAPIADNQAPKEYFAEDFWRERKRRGLARLTILPLDQLRGLPQVTGESALSGIYFLWLGPSLRYVGQSRGIATRVPCHRFTKRFDRATYVQVAEECLDAYEGRYIRRYSPPENRT